ncbi:MAG TPA: hypothetical protein VHM19_23190 [Polyangiales bacterium]|jgi:hypothetical protein|nr:hypothetical protein [Polyangiales bacterium]
MGNRVWFDTEFLEDGRTIELISIGLVRADGAVYYAETPNARELASSTPWLAEHVLPHLRGAPHDPSTEGSYVVPSERPTTRARADIARDILDFVGKSPEFWAYFADYDWVALCQLYGRMIDLPKGWPMYCRDLKQLADERGARLPAFRDASRPQHDALADALECRDRHLWLLWESRS